MKEVLIITYYWPPASGAGVQRWLKLTKYLPRCDWKPVVLTVRKGTSAALDHSLDDDIHPDISVYESSTAEPFKLYNLLRGKKADTVEEGMGNVKESGRFIEKLANFIRSNIFIPDARMGWKTFALPKAQEICKNHAIQCIITTGPPHSTHLIGKELARKTGLKWIADFRDPWTTVFYNQLLQRSRWATKRDKKMEASVLRAADHIIVVGESMKKEFEALSDKISVLHNGYDPADFATPDGGASILNKNSFNISYVGNFKYLQNHPPLWRAFQHFLDRQKDGADKVKLNFVGNVHPKVKESLEENQLDLIVAYHGYMAHHKAVQIMQESDLLLFIISDTPGNQKLISGKIFEYLQSGIPIMAVGIRGGDADNILTLCDQKPMIPFGEEDQMCDQLSLTFEQWKKNNHQTKKHVSKETQRYSRSEQARVLCTLMNSLTSDYAI